MTPAWPQPLPASSIAVACAPIAPDALQQPSDFLRLEVTDRLAERVADVRRPLVRVLELGARRGELRRALAELGIRPDLYVETELLAPPGDGHGAHPPLRVVADEELLPFADGSFDAVLSVNVLHLVNDLPGTLAQVRRALRPDGVLLAAMPGEATLAELRHALTEAELALLDGAGQRVAPFMDVRDAGALLQRAGYALPMVDLDRIAVAYREPWRLFADLRAMGETGVLAGPARPLGRALLAAAMASYRERFADTEGRCKATFDILYLTGWRPDPGQPKPAARGSGQHDLGRALTR